MQENYQSMRLLFFLLSIFVINGISAQYNLTVVVKDSATSQLLDGASVSVQGKTIRGAITDSTGTAILHGLDSGLVTLQVSLTGYAPKDVTVALPAAAPITVLLAAQANALEEVTVSSTRTGDPIETSTTKVEVLGQEEMNEESTVKPGNVASILGDISGVQIMQSSATSGNSNVRIQGLDGKYTQLLRDGMPLYDGFSGGFGVLTIPPLDLKQLELIKGAASTLYGGGAIGGLINFISKKPGYTPDFTAVLNHTTLNETNVNLYSSQRGKYFGYTLFAGQTWQKQQDVNGDGLSDLPKLNSTLIHPTLFIYPSEKSYISLGWSGSFENRLGGDMLAIKDKTNPAHPYYEEDKLQRNMFTLINENKLNHGLTLSVKGSYSSFNRSVYTNTYGVTGYQQNMYGEVSLNARIPKHNIVGGANVTGDYFTPAAATPIPAGTINNTTAGLFVQDTWQATTKTKIEGGLRADRQFTYGTFVLPRLAIFHKFSEGWGTRLGFGMGYKAPNPFTPQIKDYDLPNINALPQGIKAETSIGANAEVNYKKTWGEHNSFFINHAFFYTRVNSPVVGTEDAQGHLDFANYGKPIITQGFDTYIQLTAGNFEFYLGYTFTDARRRYLAQNQFMPLTPRNRAASTALYEVGDWRFGLEASYNGPQHRDGDATTRGYLFMAAMISKKFGEKVMLVLNCENLLDERQSRYEALYTGSLANPNFKPLWAPIDGRVINLSIKFTPFAK